MMRTSKTVENNSDLFGRVLQWIGRFVVWSWPRLEDLITRGLSRAGAALAGAETATMAGRIRSALRWARTHDTVPANVAQTHLRNYESRVERHALHEQQRAERRLKKEAVRKEREQRYSEKSSIYLG